MAVHAKKSWLKETKTFWSVCHAEYDFSEPEVLKVFELACTELNNYLLAQVEIERYGLVIEAGGNGLRANPATMIAKNSYKNFVAALKTLGILVTIRSNTSSRSSFLKPCAK